MAQHKEDWDMMYPLACLNFCHLDKIVIDGVMDKPIIPVPMEIIKAGKQGREKNQALG